MERAQAWRANKVPTAQASSWHGRGTLKIRAVGATTINVSDALKLPDLLEQIPPEQEIATITADGTYDTHRCHNAIAARGAAYINLPRHNAQLWKPTTAGGVVRNEAVRDCKYLVRALREKVDSTTEFEQTQR